MTGDRVVHGQPAKGSLEWHENKQNEQAGETGDFQIKSGPVSEDAIPQSYEDGAIKTNTSNSVQGGADHKSTYGTGQGEGLNSQDNNLQTDEGATKRRSSAAQSSGIDNKVYYGSGAAEGIYNLENLENKH